MPEIVVDGVVEAVDLQGQTWGDFVARLDGRLEGARRIVTAVRIDGVDEPTFRDPAVTDRALSSMTRVEVETGAPAVLALRCLADAGQALGTLAGTATSVADRFRDGEIRAGLDELEAITLGVVTVLRILAAAGLAFRGGLDGLAGEGRSFEELAGSMRGLVDDLIAARRAEDWVGVADTLQYDIQPALREWAARLNTVRVAA